MKRIIGIGLGWDTMAIALSQRLQAAMESAARLPSERQDELAARIETLLDELDDEAAWDAAFADPASADFFAELAAEADVADANPPQRFPMPADWTDADEEREREMDRLAAVSSPDEDNKSDSQP